MNAHAKTVPTSAAIELTVDEVHVAALHGVWRRLQARALKRAEPTEAEHTKRDRWTRDIEGACAELAFCKWRNVYWNGLSRVRAIDAGNFEVRWTWHEGTGGLYVYERDNNDSAFVLMEGFAPFYIPVGWIRGRDAKRKEWACEYGYLVPREHLTAFKAKTKEQP